MLIHLINLMRHRRVQWAAMEFLLESQKRHRNWILLKQLLLLLLRMAAVAAVVLMLAQPLLRNQWGALFGGTQDASHRAARRQLLDVRPLGRHQRLRRRPSRSSRGWPRGADARHAADRSRCCGSRARRQWRGGTQPDLLEGPLDADFAGQAGKHARPAASPRRRPPGPQDALDAVDRLPAQGGRRGPHRVSRLRLPRQRVARAGRAAQALERLATRAAQTAPGQLRRRASHQNLAIAALRPGAGTAPRACRCWSKSRVRNFGPADAQDVSVSLEEDGQRGRRSCIDEIPAGKTSRGDFRCCSPRPASTRSRPGCEADAVAADNVRSLVVDVPQGVDVLVIDGDAEAPGRVLSGHGAGAGRQGPRASAR